MSLDPGEDPSNAPFFQVVDTGRQERRAFLRGERIFFHLYIPGGHRADIVLRDRDGHGVHDSQGYLLSDDGELLVSCQVPLGARPGWYRIDITVDGILQVYQRIVICE